MKPSSIQFKFLSIVLSAMLAITIFIGGLSIYEVDNYIQRQTESFIHVTCEKEAAQINDIFGDMENSVNIMSSYVLALFSTVEDVKTPDKRQAIIEDADRMFADVAKHIPATVAYYLRFAPELSDSKTGFFFSRENGSDDFIRFESTDLALYEKEDTEHVGWYWEPYEAGEPIWMHPYYNRNNDIMMISYVVPLYCEDQFIGVVGMDFDYTILIDKVHNIEIYENGFAHLELDGTHIHIDAEAVDASSEEYLHVSNELTNGMTLILSASIQDIRHIRYEIGLRILYTVVILSAVFCLITIILVRNVVKPLKKLTEQSKKLAEGDYDVEPVHSGTYEIQLLSTAFENMAMHLREHEKLQYLLAYRDSMTGLRNTTSYKVWVTDFDKEIQKENVEFGVIMLDVNYLKETNDKFGHDVGNSLIISVAQIISETFKRSPVFRIGGDEFLVILQNRDLEDYEHLCEKLEMECANQCVKTDEGGIPISIARGFAKYDPATDTQFVDVFNRADDVMYKNKRKMKSAPEAKLLFP